MRAEKKLPPSWLWNLYLPDEKWPSAGDVFWGRNLAKVPKPHGCDLAGDGLAAIFEPFQLVRLSHLAHAHMTAHTPLPMSLIPARP
jgi:hypothetical protein